MTDEMLRAPGAPFLTHTHTLGLVSQVGCSGSCRVMQVCWADCAELRHCCNVRTGAEAVASLRHAGLQLR